MTQKKQGLDKFLQWAAEQPPLTQEEREKNSAARKAMEGKWLETVTMNENGTLLIVTSQYSIDGSVAQGSSESRPGDSDYDALMHEHGALTIGKAHTIVRKKIDGDWVVMPESDEVVPLE